MPANVFVKGQLSDLCWCLALGFAARGAVLLRWMNSSTGLLLMLVPMLAEILQATHTLPGTFDVLDIMIYGLATGLFYLAWGRRAAGRIQFRAIPFAAVFILMTLACVSSKSSYQAPKPLPCVTHKGLTYSPVLVTMYISGSYNMKDLAEVQRTLPQILLEKMNALNPYKYKMADGVKPNLSLYVTYTTDSYGHYGAEIKGYLFDGDFYTTLPTNYVTWEKLDADIVAKVNTFISYGWCSNCPSPCNP